MATIPSLPLFTSGVARSGQFNRLRDAIAFWQNPPACLIHASGTAQSIGTAAGEELVTFPTTAFDSDTMVTSSSRVTIKTAGRYRVAARLTYSLDASGRRYVRIRKNAGGVYTGGTEVASNVTTALGSSATSVETPSSFTVNLSVDDYLEVFADHDAGSALTLDPNPSTTFFTVELVAANATLSGDEGTNLASLHAATDLGTSDLDAVKGPGNYLQPTNAEATLARHYPEASIAGHLHVYSDGSASPGLIVQIFRTYVTSGFKVWERHWVDTAWGAWVQTNGVTDHGALTGLADNDHPQYLLVADAPETIRDTMGTALVAGSNVTITPNDAGDTITIAATTPPGRYVGVNAQTGTTYTPVLTDEGKLVTLTNAAAITVTLPQDTDLAFPVGGRIDFAGMGAGLATFVAGTGATVNGTPSLVQRAQYGAFTAIKVAANQWLVVGDLA